MYFFFIQSLGDHSFDTDSSISADEARVDLSWRTVLDWFKCIVTGRVQVMSRRINITHILGSVTVSFISSCLYLDVKYFYF